MVTFLSEEGKEKRLKWKKGIAAKTTMTVLAAGEGGRRATLVHPLLHLLLLLPISLGHRYSRWTVLIIPTHRFMGTREREKEEGKKEAEAA